MKLKQLQKKISPYYGAALMTLLWLLKQVVIRVGGKKQYYAFIAKLLKKNRLFDESWYLENNPDVADADINPYLHYATYGDREGRAPMPLFNPAFYKAKSKSRGRFVNTLIDYTMIGWHKKYSPSSWFDINYYLSNNKDVRKSQLEPLYHYLHFGGVEGRSPNPQFDGGWYLDNNPEVKIAKVNPLVHYLQEGHYSGLPTREENCNSVVNVMHQPWEDISKLLKPLQFEGMLEIDIIIPVYKDKDLTLRCIASVLMAEYTTPIELVVINDKSPDPELTAELQKLAERGLISLYENAENLGFVGTVNKGMSLHGDRDVLLLNSDTEVYNHWLDRIRYAAYQEVTTATVTPLSNNATICSYPRFLHDNPYPLETSYKHLDQLASQYNQCQYVEAPTGVGFCMYIRRDAINHLGSFDEDAFGKGYGEENDFCQRAIAAGWKNIIATDVFVRHLGGASFLGEKGKRITNALQVLSKRYPDYQKQVDDFIKSDPLKKYRMRLDVARLSTFTQEHNILMVCHNRGGGAERHLREDAAKAMQEGKGVFYLRPERHKPFRVRLQHPYCRQLLNLDSVVLSNTEAMCKLLEPLDISIINPHGMVDFTIDAPLHLMELAKQLNASLHIDIHDYKVICPRINLADEHGFYCGEPSSKQCNRCLKERGNDFGEESIENWRSIHRDIMKFADIVTVPDEDVQRRLEKYYSEVAYQVIPHDQLPVIKEQRNIQKPGSTLHVVVIGAISKLKGFEVLLNCAVDAKKRKLPIRFTVMGFSMNDLLLRAQGVELTGQYKESDALSILAELKPDTIWLPSIWPETYSYTLSIALQTVTPIVSFKIGAIETRLKKYNRSDYLLPLNYASEPKRINDFLIDKLNQY
ncbi:glycosyltransferase [Halomonas sp. GT]|uniref:glycosyltransferase n=1 Tax=Halomonas sp. GT TaxID=1971364 RepID=UPI0018DECC95|nr:glycosyltransferase [Halomonas sp. GT]